MVSYKVVHKTSRIVSLKEIPCSPGNLGKQGVVSAGKRGRYFREVHDSLGIPALPWRATRH